MVRAAAARKVFLDAGAPGRWCGDGEPPPMYCRLLFDQHCLGAGVPPNEIKKL
jgi:hypothetical protein